MANLLIRGRIFMRLLAILGIISMLICSCTSRIPEPINPPYSQQIKMEAAQHWEILAADLAKRINTALIRSDNIHTAVFVNDTCGEDDAPCNPAGTGSFNEAFRDFLITKLYSIGIPTCSRQDDEAITVFYKVQLVHHNAKRFRTLQPGLLTALSAAIVVLRDAPAELLILAAGGAADVANTSFVTASSYEVIITTSMVTQGHYLFRASDIYYINDKDFHHYQDYLPQIKTIRLSSDRPAAPPGYCPPPLAAVSQVIRTSTDQSTSNLN
ncbi:MAG: hypothetical protein ACWGOX_08820 [Desulforhopalus sp.]